MIILINFKHILLLFVVKLKIDVYLLVEQNRYSMLAALPMEIVLVTNKDHNLFSRIHSNPVDKNRFSYIRKNYVQHRFISSFVRI